MSDLGHVELLAPAGDMEGIRTALKYGADAIYCGGPFMQMRAEKVGFTMENLAKAAEEIHAKGKRLFVTVNCFARNDEIPRIGEYAGELKNMGVDAVIVSDIGAICEIKERHPDMEVHLSTQANCTNYKTAEMYWNMGVKRVVLARELSIEQIAELRAKAPKELQLEGFVHGAMCMSYSGRCLLSAYLTGRSGNRGECAQTCRWNYYLMEEKRPGEYYKIEEDERGTTILSSKEMCCIDILDRLAEAGLCSFKIEGRMRTPYSIGTVVNAYRMVMDGKYDMHNEKDAAVIHRELDTTSHRPFATGFYLDDKESISPDNEGYQRSWLFIGSASKASEKGKVEIVTRNPFAIGDEVEVVTPGQCGRKFRIENIIDAEGSSIDRSATPMRTMVINAPDGIQPGDLIRKEN